MCFLTNQTSYHQLYFAQAMTTELGAFVNRCWRYGYFIDCPSIPLTDPDSPSDELKLLWCARFSEVKQSHKALRILQSLKEGTNLVLTLCR